MPTTLEKQIPKWVEYITAIDSSGANSNGDMPEEIYINFDAIPRSLVRELVAQTHIDNNENWGEKISFLLLRAKVGRVEYKRLTETCDWISISVTHSDPNEESSFPALAIEFGEEVPRSQKFWVRLSHDRPTIMETNFIAKLADVQIESEFSINDFGVPLRGHKFGIAVYDVGQANFCALVNEYEHPLAFFDIGWPASFNLKSAPKKIVSFDPFALDQMERPAPVILSHLDWDHWGFAFQSGKAVWDKRGFWKSQVIYRKNALNRPWLLRRPRFKRHKLGMSHIHLMHTLRSTILPDGTRALKLWPTKTASLKWGPCTVIRCNPKHGSKKSIPFLRNNESLAMLVEDATNGARVLLCGDADYPSIKNIYRQRLIGLVAPHHGGNISANSTPVALGLGRMVFSTFPGCYSSVPSKITKTEARLHGWRISNTSDRFTCTRGHCTRGNRLIRLEITPRCTCNRVPAACLCLSQP